MRDADSVAAGAARVSQAGQRHRSAADPQLRSTWPQTGQLPARHLDGPRPPPCETEMLFDAVMREDRSVLDLMRADFTYVNDRLAQHYGIPNVTGGRFRRVPVTDDARKGLLGHGSILAVTSHAERTSPVVRGKWILENILGTPPPPPPPDVPALKENEKGQTPKTMREQMAAHRANPTCASCHKIMDPIGFALENFDAVGA